MEYAGREPNTIYSSLHTPANHGDSANSQKEHIEDIEKGYHTCEPDVDDSVSC